MNALIVVLCTSLVNYFAKKNIFKCENSTNIGIINHLLVVVSAQNEIWQQSFNIHNKTNGAVPKQQCTAISAHHNRLKSMAPKTT